MVEPATERYLRAQIEALRTDAKVVAEHREAERSNYRARIEALEGALCKAALRNDDDGPCFCVVPIPQGSVHHLSCQHIRQTLNVTKKEGT